MLENYISKERKKLLNLTNSDGILAFVLQLLQGFLEISRVIRICDAFLNSVSHTTLEWLLYFRKYLGRVVYMLEYAFKVFSRDINCILTYTRNL
jgi:hypothetical protein